MESIVKDLRLAGRMLRKAPGSSTISVLALGFGIGLCVLMFSILQGAIWRGLPFPEADELMFLEAARVADGDVSLSVGPHDFVDWRERQRSFEDLAAFSGTSINVAGGDRAERYVGAYMTASAFTLLGAQPLMGRTFTEEEEDKPGGPPVVVIGYAIWRDRFASDPDVLGRTLRANGIESTIIGVMPEDFGFPSRHALWLPMRRDPLATPRGQGGGGPVFGRLREGVSMKAAIAEFDNITSALAREHPATNEGVSAVIKPYMEEMMGEEERVTLTAMLGAVLLVLLMACANVANLLMSRTAARIKEIGVRCALGARRARIVAQFLAESFLLALAGAALGVALGAVGIRLFNNAIVGTNPPFWIDIRIDGAAVLFVLGLTLLATFAAGTLPALQAARANIQDILKDEVRGTSSLRIGRISRWLVVLDIALSCGLLVGAGLMIRSVLKLETIEFDFPTEDVFTATLRLPELDYADGPAMLAFHETLLPRLEAIPGVTSAALASAPPGLGSGGYGFGIEGVAYANDSEYPNARRATVTPSFFALFGVTALEGRVITAQDRSGALPVAVVNQSFARRFWPGESALGRRVRFGVSNSTADWLTVVGVVPDLYMDGLPEEQPEGVYIAHAQQPARTTVILARTAAEPAALARSMREAVAGLNADLPLYDVRTLATGIHEETWFVRVFGALFMTFGLVALLLAAVGLYGVMAFSVRQRTREVGVRMALGARSRDVLRMILRQGLAKLGIGLALGLPLAFLVSRFTAALLFDVSPRDPVTFAAIVVVLGATATVASLVPALRATRVAPLEALRQD